MTSTDTPAKTATKKTRNDWQTVRTLLPYLWPRGEWGLRARVVLAILFLVLAKVINVTVPLLYKSIIDALAGKAPDTLIIPVALIFGYGLARLGAQAFGDIRDAVFTKVAQRAIRLAGLKTFRHLHQLSLKFHLGRKTGAISRAVERGTKGIEFLLRFMLFNILPTLLEILFVTIVLWNLYGWVFAAITFVTLALYITWTLVFTEWRLQFRRTMNETDNEAHSKAIDSLLNYETVKYFSNEDHESKRFDQALKGYEAAAVKSETTLAFLNIGQGAIIATGSVASMWLAARALTEGDMTIGDFVLINTYLLQLFMPLNFLGFVYREIKRSLTDMESMFGLLAQKPDIHEIENAPDLEISGGEVVFENVCFAYDERRLILDDISFTVPAGKTVALVGASGSGKSTVSRLLFRFYDAKSGRILIDGQDIRHLTQRSIRRAIGMVPQDTVLFNDSIYYNIAYGRPEASPGEVEHAARVARIHDFIMALPDGYQSTVGERGLKLSGGEKQRVAIARTILKNPAIMLFDEATSALDSSTEQEILVSLKEVSSNRTTLTIAHRLSTIQDAHEILVFDQGRIVERGTHGALLEQNGLYATMWSKQQEAAEALKKLEATGELDETAKVILPILPQEP